MHEHRVGEGILDPAKIGLYVYFKVELKLEKTWGRKGKCHSRFEEIEEYDGLSEFDIIRQFGYLSSEPEDPLFPEEKICPRGYLLPSF